MTSGSSIKNYQHHCLTPHSIYVCKFTVLPCVSINSFQVACTRMGCVFITCWAYLLGSTILLVNQGRVAFLGITNYGFRYILFFKASFSQPYKTNGQYDSVFGSEKGLRYSGSQSAAQKTFFLEMVCKVR